jgi:hypothetical protein
MTLVENFSIVIDIYDPPTYERPIPKFFIASLNSLISWFPTSFDGVRGTKHFNYSLPIIADFNFVKAPKKPLVLEPPYKGAQASSNNEHHNT